MEAFFFGNSEFKNFGVYHNPSCGSKDVGIIISYSLGREYIDTYKAFNILATNLAENGFHVLRFDYSGCGDSYGYLPDQELKFWLSDLKNAINELKSGFDLKRIYLVGVRFGATLSLLLDFSEIEGMVIWSPVLNGKYYIQNLQSRYKKYIEGSFANFKEISYEVVDILGFDFSRKMIQEIEMINIEPKKIGDLNLLIIDNIEEDNEIKSFIYKIQNQNNLTVQQIINHDFWFKQRDDTRVVPIQEIKMIINWFNQI